MNTFDQVLAQHGLQLKRAKPRVLQINVGRKCNQTCAHCHVNAGPARTEMMTRETVTRVLKWLAKTDIPVVDITGGAPELNHNFRYLAEEARRLGRHVMDRCNLTILWESGQESLGEFLANHQVEVVASLPCYGAKNVDVQRGNGVFEKSIRALQKLNELGYARDEKLKLNLVYNPVDAFLPGAQSELEAIYKRELKNSFGIEFNNLYCLANMPIARFAAHLRRSGQWDEYSQLLLDNFNSQSVDGLMCRDTISVGWRGEVYDCDFNQMLNIQWCDDKPLFLWDVDPRNIEGRSIQTAEHCFGCTAGAGSSCGGAVLKMRFPNEI